MFWQKDFKTYVMTCFISADTVHIHVQVNQLKLMWEHNQELVREITILNLKLNLKFSFSDHPKCGFTCQGYAVVLDVEDTC